MTLVNKLISDPTTSFWLKARLEEVGHRDPVDFLNDIEVLAQVLEIQLLEESSTAIK
ncbi:hypothetical protein [Thalassotalea piscium]|uniref:Uncharacterized protein n=1 Tax=Thalassotalea piscium TaxID=1230533 RepID=A0A7X0NGX4_9GAMM|nr:hypothetical protein [Thalassotalea piscium]MBB6543140.1 hypothetical protein [Thalassotalea piscium]